MIRIGKTATRRSSLLSLLITASAFAYGNTAETYRVDPDHHSLLSLKSTTLEAELEALSQQLHPTDIQLVESHFDLADTLQQLGKHEEAIDAFEKALHISRVHHGLFDLRQLTIVDRMLESHFVLEKWDEVDKLQHMRFHLAKQKAPAGAETRLAALMQLTMWKLHATEYGLLADPLGAAHQVKEIHKRELELLPADAAPGSAALHHLGIADLELAQARQKARSPFTPGIDLGMPMQTLGLHGNLKLVNEQGTPSLVESFEQLPMAGGEQLDVLHISQHLSAFKSSLSTAHQLSLQPEERTPDRHETLDQSIKRSIDDYNGFVKKIRLGKF